MPLVEGKIDGKTVQIFRDTDSCRIVVWESLVKPHQNTSKIHTYVNLIDGTERKYPVAKIDISSPYLDDKSSRYINQTNSP